MMENFFNHTDQTKVGDLEALDFDQHSVLQQFGYGYMDDKVHGSTVETGGISVGIGEDVGGSMNGSGGFSMQANGSASNMGNMNSTGGVGNIGGMPMNYRTNSQNQHMRNSNFTAGRQGNCRTNSNSDDTWASQALIGMSTQGQDQVSTPAQDQGRVRNQSFGGGSNQQSGGNSQASWGMMGMIQHPGTSESPSSSRQSMSSPSDLHPLPVHQLLSTLNYAGDGQSLPTLRHRQSNLNNHAQFNPNWLNNSGLSAQSYLQNTERQFGFGTDAGFDNQRYSAPGPAVGAFGDHGKEQNLLGLSLAGRAEHMSGRHLSQPTTSQRVLQANESHSSSTSPGAQWGGPPPRPSSTSTNQQHWRPMAVHTSHNSGANMQNHDGPPRKRQKSTHDDKEGANVTSGGEVQGTIPRRGPKVPKAEVMEVMISDEYEPYTPAPKSSTKRRRSTLAEGDEATTSTTPSDTASPGPAGYKRKTRDAKSRANLSDEQKRANHILSEQKRRDLIKKSFDDLNQLVPSLKGGKSGLSRAEVITEIVKYLEGLVAGNKEVAKRLGVPPEDYSNVSADLVT